MLRGEGPPDHIVSINPSFNLYEIVVHPWLHHSVLKRSTKRAVYARLHTANLVFCLNCMLNLISTRLHMSGLCSANSASFCSCSRTCTQTVYVLVLASSYELRYLSEAIASQFDLFLGLFFSVCLLAPGLLSVH